jgi:hypothetical protein
VRRDDGTLGEGLGDVGLGVKRVMFFSQRTETIFSVAAEVLVPSGDEADGLGRGTFVFEPFVMLGQAIPYVGFVHLQAGVELPFDPAKAGRELFWRGALGRSFTQGRFGRTWSPMVELLAARELERGATVRWDVVPQFQVTLNQRQHLMLNLGARIPLTERGVRSTQVLAYLLWDWFDGGLFEGW